MFHAMSLYVPRGFVMRPIPTSTWPIAYLRSGAGNNGWKESRFFLQRYCKISKISTMVLNWRKALVVLHVSIMSSSDVAHGLLSFFAARIRLQRAPKGAHCGQALCRSVRAAMVSPIHQCSRPRWVKNRPHTLTYCCGVFARESHRGFFSLW